MGQGSQRQLIGSGAELEGLLRFGALRGELAPTRLQILPQPGAQGFRRGTAHREFADRFEGREARDGEEAVASSRMISAVRLCAGKTARARSLTLGR